MAVLLAACGSPTAPGTAPAADPIMGSGESAENPCELALVAHLEFAREQGAVDPRLESDLFDACTFAEFTAANAKLAERHRYPGDGKTYVGRNCVRLVSFYRGSRLCRSR